MEQTVYL